MGKSPIPTENSETACPACGGAIKAPASARRRRVQCPKCREVVFLESMSTLPPMTDVAAAPAPVVNTDERGRIDRLEARVEALEAALRESAVALRQSIEASRETASVLRDSVAAAREPVSSASEVDSATTESAALVPATVPAAEERRIQWRPVESGQAPDFSAEQGKVLCHNLGHVKTQAIEIRTPAGDHYARARAEWFKSVFESAGWTVRGPEEVTLRAAAAGLSLAVPDLPVPKDAAATYFALKAAGFEPIQVLDAALGGLGRAGGPVMALTLPPEKAA